MFSYFDMTAHLEKTKTSETLSLNFLSKSGETRIFHCSCDHGFGSLKSNLEMFVLSVTGGGGLKLIH